MRKSLLIADRSSGRTRFSMLETIRQFAEEQLVAGGDAEEARTAHARHFAGRETGILALWDSPRQREAYDWFTVELANLRTAFRWAADHNDLDVAATIATYAGLLGLLIENYEPTTWAEELIEPSRAIRHPRLAALYVMASQCYTTGRVDDAVQYCDAAVSVLAESRDSLPYGIDGMVGGAYVYIGQPQRWVEVCRSQLQRRRATTAHIRACLVFALVMMGSGQEATAAADDLIEVAEAMRNPFMLSFALHAYGYAFRETDPDRALDAFRRGLTIAQDSGNRFTGTQLAIVLGTGEAERGNNASAFDHLGLAIENMHDSGNITTMRTPLAVLAVLFDELDRHEASAIIAGFALSTLTALAVPELGGTIAHLRDVLGDQTYESLARVGETMTTSEVATYAYDQIDQARAELNGVSK